MTNDKIKLILSPSCLREFPYLWEGWKTLVDVKGFVKVYNGGVFQFWVQWIQEEVKECQESLLETSWEYMSGDSSLVWRCLRWLWALLNKIYAAHFLPTESSSCFLILEYLDGLQK